MMTTDCLVIGDGLAAHAYAHYATQLGLRVTMVSPQAKYPSANSDLAQGGIIYNRPDDIEGLVKDIMDASAGMANLAAARYLAETGSRLVDDLLITRSKVPFATDELGVPKRTREGGHHEARIIYFQDTTGHAILSHVVPVVEGHPNLTCLHSHVAVDLLTLSHNSVSPQDRFLPATCTGAFVLNKETGVVFPIFARKTILATGGLGQIYRHTTNQSGVVGSGYAMAYRVGARLQDLEYVQFHPTSLMKKGFPRFLVSEAVRGEGAVLRNRKGDAFMETVHPMKSLAPRDIVARAIHNEVARSGDECVFLDISPIGLEEFRHRFPAIYQKCLDYGVPVDAELRIPVIPAAHYTCGGVYTDLRGRTSILNLNAIGETACTGLHGANRLASTSLLECLTTGYATAMADANEVPGISLHTEVRPWEPAEEPADEVLIQQDFELVRETMWNYVGLVRSQPRLARADRILSQLQTDVDQFYRNSKVTEPLINLRNALQAARLVVYAAQRNPVSKGCHFIQP